MNEQQRASRFLRSLRQWTERLHWYISVAHAVDLSEFDERMRESFPYEWDNAIGRFVPLEAFSQRGLLTPPEQADFHRLASDLTDICPRCAVFDSGSSTDLDALARASGRPAATPTS